MRKIKGMTASHGRFEQNNGISRQQPAMCRFQGGGSGDAGLHALEARKSTDECMAGSVGPWFLSRQSAGRTLLVEGRTAKTKWKRHNTLEKGQRTEQQQTSGVGISGRIFYKKKHVFFQSSVLLGCSHTPPARCSASKWMRGQWSNDESKQQMSTPPPASLGLKMDGVVSKLFGRTHP